MPGAQCHGVGRAITLAVSGDQARGRRAPLVVEVGMRVTPPTTGGAMHLCVPSITRISMARLSWRTAKMPAMTGSSMLSLCPGSRERIVTADTLLYAPKRQR